MPNTLGESLPSWSSASSPKYLEKLNISQVTELMKTASTSPQYDEVQQTLTHMKQIMIGSEEVNAKTREKLEQLANILAYAKFEKASDSLVRRAQNIMKDVGERFFLEETVSDEKAPSDSTHTVASLDSAPQKEKTVSPLPPLSWETGTPSEKDETRQKEKEDKEPTIVVVEYENETYD